MCYLLEVIVNPLVTAFFTVVGGAIPFGILLFLYSIRQKRRLMEFVPHQKDYLAKLNEQKEIAKNQVSEFEERVGNVGEIIGDNTISEEERKGRIDFYSGLRDSLLKLEVSVIEAEAFISHAEKYNFWTVIEDLLRKQYIGKGFLGRKDD